MDTNNPEIRKLVREALEAKLEYLERGLEVSEATLDDAMAYTLRGVPIEQIVSMYKRGLRDAFNSPNYQSPKDQIPNETIKQLRDKAKLTWDPRTEVQFSEDAPMCSKCGVKMFPNGSCYLCHNCGSTSGCS